MASPSPNPPVENEPEDHLPPPPEFVSVVLKTHDLVYWTKEWFEILRERFKWVWAYPKAFAEMFNYYWPSKRFQSFILGMPAFLTAIVLVVILLLTRTVSNQHLRNTYTVAANTSQMNKRSKDARFFYERLLSLGDQSPATLLGYVQALHATGDLFYAEQLLGKLAPHSTVGYGPAHRYVAEQAFKADPQLQTPRSRLIVERHLKMALRYDPDNARICESLGNLYLLMGDPLMAEPYLQRASAHRPEIRLALAKLYHDRGMVKEMIEEAEAALKELRFIIELHPGNHMARLATVETLTLLRRYEDAEELLVKALRQFPEQPYRQVLSGLYARRVDETKDRFDTSVRDQLDLLEKALFYDPRNPAALAMLGKYLHSEPKFADELRAKLHDLITNGHALPMAHFILGNDAYIRGELDIAKLHLEEALRLRPTMIPVANNLAHILCSQDPPDLERALELVNQALARSPHSGELCLTRGQILIRMGRPREALTNLEVALATLPKSLIVHRSLAECYEKLNVPALAQRHADMAKQMEGTNIAADAASKNLIDEPPTAQPISPGDDKARVQ